MQKTTDAMVTAADLGMAIEEMRRGYSQATMARLLATELHLAVYIEGIAGHLVNQSKSEKQAHVLADAMQRILVIVRAMEIGHYRMWRDTISPTSPLARMMDRGPQDGPKEDRENT